MMRIIRGDLLESHELVIIHGCNCFNMMGAGIAAQIARRYPQAAATDIRTTCGDIAKLGTYSYAITFDPKIMAVRYIFNAYTQHKTASTKNPIPLDYHALIRSIDSILRDFPSIPKFGLPKIGCGLAGGDWNKVRAILEDLANIHDRTFTIYTLEK